MRSICANVKDNGKLCQRSFKSLAELVVHVHLDHNKYMCPKCELTFSEKFYFDLHVRGLRHPKKFCLNTMCQSLFILFP